MHIDTPAQKEIRDHAYHEVARNLPYPVTLDHNVEAFDVYSSYDGGLEGINLGTVRDIVDQAVEGIFRFHGDDLR